MSEMSLNVGDGSLIVYDDEQGQGEEEGGAVGGESVWLGLGT